MLSERLERAFTSTRAETDPRSRDPRLLGRTYAIPFDQVWRACLDLVEGHRRWALLQTNDVEGYIRARCETPLLRFVDDLEIRIGLDGHALTRVDVKSRSRKKRVALGIHARRIGRFLRHLDRALNAGPGTILDPNLLETWSLEAG